MSATPPSPPTVKGINHIKVPCKSITATHTFYTDILGFTPQPQWNHYTPEHKLFAMMCMHEPTKLIVELRYHPVQAAAQKGWDPITWGVGTRKGLEEWAVWLDGKGIKRSAILTGIKAWVMGCEDPDGRIVRLYVEDEEHEWTDNPDQDEFWLGTVQADPAA